MDSGFVRHRKTGNITQTRNPGGRCKNRALARPSMNADRIPRLFRHRSRSGAGYREYPGIGADFVFADIGPRHRHDQGWARHSKSTGELWRNSPIRLEKGPLGTKETGLLRPPAKRGHEGTQAPAPDPKSARHGILRPGSPVWQPPAASPREFLTPPKED